MADSQGQAEFIAQALDSRNRERQQIEQQIVEEVITKVKQRFRPDRDFVIVEGCADWHVGVIGIVASRLMREFSRPTIVIGSEGGDWRGSGRSVEGFDLAAALRECDELLVRHGGHAMAAGLTISPKNVDDLRRKLNHLASQLLNKELLKPKLRLDAEILLGDLTMEQLEDLERIQPTGQANPPIQLVAKNVWHKRPPRRIGRDKQHAKLWITDGDITHEAVVWRIGSGRLPDGAFDLAFAPQINQFQGRRSVQLKVLDWNEH
jgi:single-stranded-DNA-specific exonuclease